VAHGSRFVLVTDGVTDQLGGHDCTPVAFGYKRLLNALTTSAKADATQTAHGLLQAVTLWQGAQTRRDDLTIIALDV
jgi:serine phosphatase RsbU (regulator of sigma subunit)